MDRKELIKRIGDPTIPLDSLDNTIILDYINIHDSVKDFEKTKDFVFSFGVNVRLSSDANDIIIPLNYNNGEFIAKERAKRVSDGYKIPDFMTKSLDISCKDVFFRVSFTKEGNEVIIKDFKVHKLYHTRHGELNRDYLENEYNKNEDKILTKISKEFNDFFCVNEKVSENDKNNTFLHENIRSLCPNITVRHDQNPTYMYVWVRGEDPDISNKINYLTNIFAISNVFDITDKIRHNCLEPILELVMLLKSRRILDFNNKQKKEATKSAKAAIMSRNMSHNLGSHFISNTKNYFNALIDVDNNNQAVYRGVKYALQYIQERMDFIATVTSDDIYPFGPVNAKAQVFDELAPDDLGKRHDKCSLNFLMDYLVLSEKISKRSHLKCKNSKTFLSDGLYGLKLIMGYEDEKGNVFFWNSEQTTSEENEKRNHLVNINFAIPGGVLGRHALFSIIENIIRNAAKHGQDMIKENLTIKMLCTNDGHIVVFDNKSDKSINETVKNLNKRLLSLKMLNDNSTLNQDNKGLKEILICAAWLQNADFPQIVQSRNFNEYVNILAVDEYGKPLSNDSKEGFLAYRIRLERYKKVVHLSNGELGIPEDAEKIDTGLFNLIKADIVCASKDYQVGETKTKLSQVFPRFFVLSLDDFNKKVNKVGENKLAIDLLRTIVERNCHIKTNNLQMVLSSDKKNDFKGSEPYPVVFYDAYCEKSKDDFLYKIHAGKSKESIFETLYFTKEFEGKYIDSISGGDFTYTITQPSFVKDEYNLLKVYESVKTRFVIIDERIFEQHRSNLTNEQRNKMIDKVKDIQKKISDGKKTVENLSHYLFENEKGPNVLGLFNKKENEQAQSLKDMQSLKDFLKDDTKLLEFLEKDIEQHYLERKNIHVLSFGTNHNNYELNDISGKEYGHFVLTNLGLKFNPTDGHLRYFKPCETSPITFLTIHLGLIDKVKDSLGKTNDPNFNEANIVEELKSYFGANYVSIHSGRGGFDVRNSLKKYVFQSYSAVENPLYNSKFLLSQQFYNLNYYGGTK